MEEKVKIKVSIWKIIFPVFMVILLMLLVGIFYYHYKTTEEKILPEVEESKASKYYEPSEEEKVRTAELEKILRANMPVMDGSTSTIPLEGGIKSALFEISQEKAEAGVAHATTYGSYDNLLNGKCDIIFSTPLSEKQYQSAKDANIELVEVPVVLEGFVFVVNAQNPIDSLTQQQLKDIYSGKITNWKELGGNDAEIVAYQRNETSGSQNYMKAFMKDSNLMEPKTKFTPASMVGLMDAVATYDNAINSIGYSVYAYAANMYGNGNEIKFIKVDGVEPTKETMASREYPLLNYNYAIYDKKSEETTKVKELTEWLLTYNGQVAMVNAGYVPVKNVKIKEVEIEAYTEKGTSTETRSSKLDGYFYYVNSNITDRGAEGTNNLLQIEKLKNKTLQSTINTFIKESYDKLEGSVDECKNYVKLLNDYYNKINEDKWTQYMRLYLYDGIITEITCTNGYLSVNIALKYTYGVGSAPRFTYKAYSKIYDLYSGKEISLSDLFYKNTNFVETINQQIENRIPRQVEMGEQRIETKRNFNSLPKEGFLVSLDYDGTLIINFNKENPYFVEGAKFRIDTYTDNISCTYKARDMKDIFEDGTKITKENYIIYGDLIDKKETDNYEYDICYLSNDTNYSKFINNYIDTNLINDEYITKLEEEKGRKNSNYNAIKNSGSKENHIITIRASVEGMKYAKISISGGVGLFAHSIYFDIETEEIVSEDVVEKWREEITSSTNIVETAPTQTPTPTPHIETNEPETNTANVAEKIVGEWKAERVVDENGTDKGLSSVYGTGIRLSNILTFKEDGTFRNGIGVTGDGNEDGTYTVENNMVMLTYSNGETTTFVYNTSDGSMSEDKKAYGTDKHIVIYVKRTEEEIKKQEEYNRLRTLVSGEYHFEKATVNGKVVEFNEIYPNEKVEEFIVKIDGMWVNDFKFPNNDKLVIARPMSKDAYVVDDSNHTISFSILSEEYEDMGDQWANATKGKFEYQLNSENEIDTLTYTDNSQLEKEIVITLKKVK